MQSNRTYVCLCVALYFQKCVEPLEILQKQIGLASTVTQKVLLHKIQVFVLFTTHEAFSSDSKTNQEN